MGMDYVWTVNGKEVFGQTQPAIIKEILDAKLKLTMEVERGTFIVPSFDEIWPNPNKVREKKLRRMGMEYILEAMQHHGLTTSPPAAAWASRSISTTTPWSATTTTPSRR